MSGFSVAADQHLIRANLWSRDLKEPFLDELMGIKYVRMIQDFPDGTTINIPSLGQMEADDYAEGRAIQYRAFATGNYQFQVNEYKSVATYIYRKYMQDSFYAQQVVSSFVPKMHRALAVDMETKLLSVGPAAQTASALNTINGGDHRFVASGTSQVITLEDFARAKYALKKANVPMTNLVAIVDPSVAFELETLTNLVNVSNNPNWEGIITSGMTTGMRYIRSIYGFDVYESNYLPVIGAETIDSVSVNSTGVANLFFSAAQEALPFIGQVRQPPIVDSEFNKDLQREEYVVTCRYDFALFRPENLVTILSATDQVGA